MEAIERACVHAQSCPTLCDPMDHPKSPFRGCAKSPVQERGESAEIASQEGFRQQQRGSNGNNR